MSDSDDLRILVELAARGELSDAETTEVEALIADKPHLAAEYQRLRAAPVAPARSMTDAEHATTARPVRLSTQRRAGNQSGCLLALGGFFAALVIVTVAGFVVMSRRGSVSPSTTDPIAAVLDDPNNEVLELQGPADLVEFGTLALMYSPTTHDGVLLGENIATGGQLVDTGGATLATFSAGDVEVFVEDLDPDQTLTVVANDPSGVVGEQP